MHYSDERKESLDHSVVYTRYKGDIKVDIKKYKTNLFHHFYLERKKSYDTRLIGPFSYLFAFLLLFTDFNDFHPQLKFLFCFIKIFKCKDLDLVKIISVIYFIRIVI